MAADGSVLARSVRAREGTYTRTYPKRRRVCARCRLLLHHLGQAGLERFRNAAAERTTGTNLQSILDQLQGKRTQGDEVADDA